ncbi:uncharacterized protein F5891DRAFT_1189772 [Suillus fuscotomentosus]|uniref:CCHC-type domain-containing protein n=1 Tax=Suillus fuscotomentosus TaxID=1912939 RepID=A0AAD4HKC1_9AGAM|nr:uncharacterized protein F5891DRAFT_1189772 [Suillus fuscotomentosus]KAG1899336.1 hypothetical protein F5891DRAFT_1189772 [Suillus fuscotomentosus]
MSYMKTGYAGEWAALTYDREKAKSASHRWDWDTFIKDLKVVFSPINEICDAQEHLATFTQGKMPIEEFLTRWMQILVMAEYSNVKANTTTVDHLINILRTNAHINIIDSVDEEPEMYGANRKTPNPTYYPSYKPSTSQSNPTSPTSTDRADGSGVTYGGHGQPMDLSRQHAHEGNLCYRCGQAGHIAWNCKNHVQAICQMLNGLDEEEKKGVVESLGF